jgi:hypothetical protein
MSNGHIPPVSCQSDRGASPTASPLLSRTPLGPTISFKSAPTFSNCTPGSRDEGVDALPPRGAAGLPGGRSSGAGPCSCLPPGAIAWAALQGGEYQSRNAEWCATVRAQWSRRQALRSTEFGDDFPSDTASDDVIGLPLTDSDASSRQREELKCRLFQVSAAGPAHETGARISVLCPACRS